MQGKASSSGNEQNAMMEESVLFRIQQLQKGLLQFTDSTNAYRLVKAFGKDIRYIAPWKKWLVWDKTPRKSIFTRKQHRDQFPAIQKTAKHNSGQGKF